MSGAGPQVDIVVPVHGGLHHARHCLIALAEHTSAANVVVVDDASTPHEARRLDELVRELDGDVTFDLLRNSTNLGYLHSVNRGIAYGRAPYVVTLNSDVLVTPGWLDGLLAALDAAPANAIATPLSNHANLTRIEFPWGATHLEVAAAVRDLSTAAFPEIGIASGFCMIISRDHLDALGGGFDEAYAPGYFEESDLCLRAMEQGMRVVADDTTFVFHHGWASFGPERRTVLMDRNAAIFEARWGNETHRSWQERVRAERPFAELEAAVATRLGSGTATTGWGPRWNIERARRDASGPSPHPRAPDGLHAPRPQSDPARPGSTVLLLPSIDASAAARSLLRLASELVLRGRDVHVATSGPVDLAGFADPVVLRPFVFSEAQELLEGLPAHDLVVVTSVHDLPLALALRDRDDCRVATLLGEDAGRPVLASSDVAAWIAADGLGRADQHWVRTTTGLVPGDTGVARRRGPGARLHVPYGVDLDVFHPTQPPVESAHVVVTVSSHARVAEWRTLVDAMDVVRDRLPGVQITLHGSTRSAPSVAADVAGNLTLTEEVRLLRGASVLVDSSAAAPSVRSRLRGLAVGVPLVVPDGHDPSGVTLPGHNCLAVTPGDPDELARTVLGVIKDPHRDASLVAAGLVTAHAFALGREVDAAERALDAAHAVVRGPRHEPREATTRAGTDPDRRGLLALAQETVMARHDELATELGTARRQLEALRGELDGVYDSETWRVGRAVMRLPRLLRRGRRARGGRRE